MLKKEYKLKSNSEITRVFKNGKTVKSSFLFLRFRANETDKTKIAFSVGLKYSRRAVDRNRAKRVLRAGTSKYIDKIKSGYDLVFYFDKNFQEDLALKKVETPLMSCLSQAKLLKWES